ncbi:class I SAM-dependent methyltransferase [Ilumatobacter nonamiensis]|uniref:class I SAM-dependent methyltransferase n=1 Tax=Ilumatobacter nonamiensis TaxID=467093 RepID=UPI00034B4F1F|nr:class I SAM-dependent methyltransferase [Ilumatobacter nonamiensis]
MVEQSKWVHITNEDPEHSNRYIERFRDLAANGMDLDGEARLIDAMSTRGSRILDAGCGPGRTGGALARAGHTVVGVDVDPILIAAAENDHPGPTWLVGDLAELDLASRGVDPAFDVIVCAGNVMAFLAASTRRAVLSGFRSHLATDGRAVVGFGGERGYEFDEFFDDVQAAGLVVEVTLSTWDLRPFSDDSDFLVAVLRRSA